MTLGRDFILTFFLLYGIVRLTPPRTWLYDATRVVRYVINLCLFLYGLLVCSCLGLAIGLLTSLDPRPQTRFCVNARVARCFALYCGLVLGWRFEIIGKENLKAFSGRHHQPAVFVGNHQSMIDIAYLGYIFPWYCSIMAKKEIKILPLLGQWRTIFIDRKNRKSALESFAHVGQEMKAHRTSLWVFPEGTRSLTPQCELLPFKLGAFHCAMQAKVPIVPVVCQHYFHLYDGRSRFDIAPLRIQGPSSSS